MIFKLVKLAIFIGTVISQLATTEENECFIDGECISSPYVREWSVFDAQECLEQCQDFEGCEFFTYYGLDDQRCMGFSACVELSEESCEECYSGSSSCPDLHCWIKGSCDGNLISEDYVGLDSQCLDMCKAEESCEWFTYDDADGACLLLEGCGDFSTDDCPTCWSGQQPCGERKDLTKIFVVAGWNDHFELQSMEDVQLLDLSLEEQNCQDPFSYPFQAHSMVGTLFNGVPLVCGGYNADMDIYTDECFQYDGTWTAAPENMLSSRLGHRASLVDSATWLISGGQSEAGEFLDSTEVWHDGQFSYGPSLPSPLKNHCQVTLNSSHIAVLGGYDGSEDRCEFYLLDWPNQEWIRMPDLPVRIWGSVNGQELVVLSDYETCQIFNFRDHGWRIGPWMSDDMNIFEGSMVAQMEKNFYLLGGKLSNNGSTTDFVVEFDAESYQWVKQNFTMSIGRCNGVVIPVPENAQCP